MIKITKVQPGPHVDWSLEGNTLTIGDEIVLDLEEERRDTQRILDICRAGDGLTVGMAEGYVASILIPPIQYEEVVIENGTEEGESGKIPLPLEIAAVELKLWQYEKDKTTEEGAE